MLLLIFLICAITSVSADVSLTEPIEDIMVKEDEIAVDELNLNNHFTDGGSELSFSAVSADYKIDISIEEDGSVDLEPPKDWFGAEEITFIASDGQQKVSDTVVVLVEPKNDGPVLTESLPDASFSEDNQIVGAFNLYDHFSDIDSLLEFKYSSENILVSIRENGDVDISARTNWYGSEEVTFEAFDGETTSSDTITVSVISVNDEPQCKVNFDSISLKGTSPERTLDLYDYFSDADDDNLIFVVKGNKRLKYELDQEKGNLKLLSSESWSGKEILTVTALDSQGSARSMQVVVIKAPTYDSQGPVFYLTGLVLGLAVVGTKLQFTSRRREIRSPVKLESYRHYKGN
jgi:hypothetical protein